MKFRILYKGLGADDSVCSFCVNAIAVWINVEEKFAPASLYCNPCKQKVEDLVYINKMINCNFEGEG